MGIIKENLKNIVTIGGGTGSFILLTGLKKYPVNISAIVSMADDGGSTGTLRDELGVLPPGDVRKCLVALSESSDILRELMNYRFESGRLNGHSFGNLLLSALEKITGNFAEGVEEVVKILNVKGEVIPVTNENMRLIIQLKNGKILKGEKFLDYNKEIHRVGLEKVYLEKKVKAWPQAIESIKKSDFIIIGPGDHFGSILPNLMVAKIREAIRKSKARVIYNCNLTNKKGQTIGYDLDHYVKEINSYIGPDRINFVTFNKTRPSGNLVMKYEKLEGKNSLVVFDNNKKKRSFKIIQADMLQKTLPKMSTEDLFSRKHSFIRHDPDKLAKVLMSIINTKA